METNAVEVVGSSVDSVNYLQTVQSMGLDYGFRILGAIAILVIGFTVVGIAKKIIVRAMMHQKVDQTLIGFISVLAHVGMKIAVIIAALEALDVKTASFVAVLGAAGLAVGFALQGSLSNFAAGILMIILKPFAVGDVIEAGGTLGTVRSIDIFNTHIDTLDNKKTIVPNAKILSDNIVNYAANDTRRVDIKAGISYGDDIDKARAGDSRGSEWI